MPDISQYLRQGKKALTPSDSKAVKPSSNKALHPKKDK